MKRVSIMGSCLVAMFAMAAVMAGTASAAPEFKTCVTAAKVGTEYPTGEFSDRYCSKSEAGGEYRLGSFSEAKKTSLKIKGGVFKKYSVNPETGKYVGYVEGKSEEGTGEYTATGMIFKLEYKDYESEKKSCKTEGPGEERGVISTEELKGTLVNLPEGKIGLEVVNDEDPGSTIEDYNCEGLEVDVVGGVIGEVIGGRTEATKELAFKFAANSAGSAEGSLQQWLYPSSTISETQGYADAYKWFGNPAEPEPTMLYEALDRGVYVLPAVQSATSTSKGEALKIVG